MLSSSSSSDSPYCPIAIQSTVVGDEAVRYTTMSKPLDVTFETETDTLLGTDVFDVATTFGIAPKVLVKSTCAVVFLPPSAFTSIDPYAMRDMECYCFSGKAKHP